MSEQMAPSLHASRQLVSVHLWRNSRSAISWTLSDKPREEFTVSRRYIEGTPILETTFTTSRGTARLIDLIPIVDGAETLQPMRELLRIIKAVSGELELEIRIDPRPNYGRTKPQIKKRGELGWYYSWSLEVDVVMSLFLQELLAIRNLTKRIRDLDQRLAREFVSFNRISESIEKESLTCRSSPFFARNGLRKPDHNSSGI